MLPFSVAQIIGGTFLIAYGATAGAVGSLNPRSSWAIVGLYGNGIIVGLFSVVAGIAGCAVHRKGSRSRVLTCLVLTSAALGVTALGIAVNMLKLYCGIAGSIWMALTTPACDRPEFWNFSRRYDNTDGVIGCGLELCLMLVNGIVVLLSASFVCTAGCSGFRKHDDAMNNQAYVTPVAKDDIERTFNQQLLSA